MTRISKPSISRWVAKLCRKVWGVTFLTIPDCLTACFTAFYGRELHQFQRLPTKYSERSDKEKESRQTPDSGLSRRHLLPQPDEQETLLSPELPYSWDAVCCENVYNGPSSLYMPLPCGCCIACASIFPLQDPAVSLVSSADVLDMPPLIAHNSPIFYLW